MKLTQQHCKIVEAEGVQVLFRVVFNPEEGSFQVAVSLWTEDNLLFEMKITPKKEDLEEGDEHGLNVVANNVMNAGIDDVEFALETVMRLRKEAEDEE